MFIHFKSADKNRWDIRIDGGKKGRIEKRRGSFVAILTRPVDLAGLEGVCIFVAEKNSQR
jgi:hypothetical protein